MRTAILLGIGNPDIRLLAAALASHDVAIVETTEEPGEKLARVIQKHAEIRDMEMSRLTYECTLSSSASLPKPIQPELPEMKRGRNEKRPFYHPFEKRPKRR